MDENTAPFTHSFYTLAHGGSQHNWQMQPLVDQTTKAIDPHEMAPINPAGKETGRDTGDWMESHPT